MDQQKIKILIADDSAITRGIFEKNFNASGLFEIVGMVSNGRKAIDFCSENDVDLVISDYDMPEMNGIETTRILTKQFGIPVCIYADNNSVRSQALQEGAMLFEVRPSFTSFTSQSMTPFIEKIAETYTKRFSSTHHHKRPASADTTEKKKTGYPAHSFDILCIGASTGGPTAVQEILKGLGNDFPLPILYVQHIDSGSDKKMVEWFNQTCPNTPMELAEDGQPAKKGHVYMAPADTHLIIDYINAAGAPVLKLSDEPPERFLKPAVNTLFRSAASLYKQKCLAVLLTGMGRDGAEGCKVIVDNGGYTIAEDKSTCAVFGMPAAAIELDAATKVYPRGIIAQEILKLV